MTVSLWLSEFQTNMSSGLSIPISLKSMKVASSTSKRPLLTNTVSLVVRRTLFILFEQLEQYILSSNLTILSSSVVSSGTSMLFGVLSPRWDLIILPYNLWLTYRHTSGPKLGLCLQRSCHNFGSSFIITFWNSLHIFSFLMLFEWQGPSSDTQARSAFQKFFLRTCQTFVALESLWRACKTCSLVVTQHSEQSLRSESVINEHRRALTRPNFIVNVTVSSIRQCTYYPFLIPPPPLLPMMWPRCDKTPFEPYHRWWFTAIPHFSAHIYLSIVQIYLSHQSTPCK